MSSHQLDTTVVVVVVVVVAAGVVATVVYILYMKRLSYLQFPLTPTYPLFLKVISNFTYAILISTCFIRNTTRM